MPDGGEQVRTYRTLSEEICCFFEGGYEDLKMEADEKMVLAGILCLTERRQCWDLYAREGYACNF